jgi:hypothetical protein
VRGRLQFLQVLLLTKDPNLRIPLSRFLVYLESIGKMKLFCTTSLGILALSVIVASSLPDRESQSIARFELPHPNRTVVVGDEIQWPHGGGGVQGQILWLPACSSCNVNEPDLRAYTRTIIEQGIVVACSRSSGLLSTWLDDPSLGPLIRIGDEAPMVAGFIPDQPVLVSFDQHSRITAICAGYEEIQRKLR